MSFQTRGQGSDKDWMKGVSFPSKPVLFVCLFFQMASRWWPLIWEKHGEAGQKTEASEQNFSGLKITSMSRLRSLAWLFTYGTTRKQIDLNAFKSLRALSCHINKSSLENPTPQSNPSFPKAPWTRRRQWKLYKPWEGAPLLCSLQVWPGEQWGRKKVDSNCRKRQLTSFL